MSNLHINTNIAAHNAHRNIRNASVIQERASQRLTSGMRIVTAADDASGLAISEKIRSQIMGMEQASRNSQDGISLIDVADGGLQSISDKIHRLRELMIYASNDTQSPSDRELIQNEVDKLLDEIDRMSEATQFNGRMLLSGNYASGVTIISHLAAPIDLVQTIAVSADSLLGLQASLIPMQLSADSAQLDVDASRATLMHVLAEVRSSANALGGFGGTAGSAAERLEALLNAAVDAISTTNTAAGLAASGGRAPEELWRDVDIAMEELDTATFFNPEQPQARSKFLALREEIQAPELDLAFGNFAKDLQSLDTALQKLAQTSVLVAQGQAKMNEAMEEYQRPVVATRHGPLHLQVGANSNNSAWLNIERSDTAGLGIDILHRTGPFGGGATGSGEDISGRLDLLDNALNRVAVDRGLLGAMSNRLQHTIEYLDMSSENQSAAKSRITDADMAREMMNLVRGNILQQASLAMLSQANQAPNNVLQLLG